MTLKSLKPAVSKTWLIVMAGLMWSVAGLMLCRLAYHWLVILQWRWIVPRELLGVVLALTAHKFCFSRIAQKNIERLSVITEKTCIFAFQRWKSYLVIALMTIIGITLRNSPVPRPYLAILYTTIGGALFLASLKYYSCLWRMVVQRSSCLPPGKITDYR
jgi:hypothetical protein